MLPGGGGSKLNIGARREARDINVPALQRPPVKGRNQHKMLYRDVRGRLAGKELACHLAKIITDFLRPGNKSAYHAGTDISLRNTENRNFRHFRDDPFRQWRRQRPVFGMFDEYDGAVLRNYLPICATLRRSMSSLKTIDKTGHYLHFWMKWTHATLRRSKAIGLGNGLGNTERCQ